MAALNRRSQATLFVCKSIKTSDFIISVRTIILCVGNNSTIFKTPHPPLIYIADTLSNLEKAEITNSGSKSCMADLNIKYDIALKAVKDLLGYVQTIVDNAEDEITATSIINASGFGLTEIATKIKASFIR
jgi:hypothetical protein